MREYIMLPDGTVLRDDAQLITLTPNTLTSPCGKYKSGVTAWYIDVLGKHYIHFWGVSIAQVFNAFLDRPINAPLPKPSRPWWQCKWDSKHGRYVR